MTFIQGGKADHGRPALEFPPEPVGPEAAAIAWHVLVGCCWLKCVRVALA